VRQGDDEDGAKLINYAAQGANSNQNARQDCQSAEKLA
jgi:hypothetical protein